MSYCIDCGHDVVSTFCASCGSRQPTSMSSASSNSAPASEPGNLQQELKSASRCKCGAVVRLDSDTKPACWNCGRTAVMLSCPDCQTISVWFTNKPKATSFKCSRCKQRIHFTLQQIEQYLADAAASPSLFSISCQQCNTMGMRFIWRERRRPASVIPGPSIVTSFQGHYEYWKDALCPTCGHSYQFTERHFGHNWPDEV